MCHTAAAWCILLSNYSPQFQFVHVSVHTRTPHAAGQPQVCQVWAVQPVTHVVHHIKREGLPGPRVVGVLQDVVGGPEPVCGVVGGVCCGEWGNGGMGVLVGEVARGCRRWQHQSMQVLRGLPGDAL